ncbi:MAG: hypothetical protein K2L98_03300 [Bacilli bacterium]|nr:hypothetical protein [Bacilli bacterium]
MIRKLIDKLKYKKEELVEVSSRVETEEKQEEKVDIVIDTYKNFFRMYISNYVSVNNYDERTNEIDPDKMSDNISMNIMWNSGRQKINKGTFYVLLEDNVIYNFMIDGDKIKIDERIKFDEESHERIFSFDLGSGAYRLVFFKHNRFGSTFHNMSYPPDKYMEEFGLTREETYDEVKGLLERVEQVENILDLMDVNLIKDVVLNDLKPDGVKKEYKDNEKK